MNTIKDLFRPARTPCGVDEGPCIFYYQLSYRRRFLRDLFWMPLFSIIALLVIIHGYGNSWTPVAFAFYLIPPVFDFINWNRFER